MFGLNKEELAIFKELSTPEKIQDFLDTIPVNLDKNGGTCFSPRMVLARNKAHCIEGAFVAATALWLHGEKPLLLDLKALSVDYDHVVALYKKNGYWGAISKTNHPVLRFRDPIYRSPRELALSYFHEYTLPKTGQKTLRTYSLPFSLKKFGDKWITSEKSLWEIAQTLDESRHFSLVPKINEKYIRSLSPIELEATKLSEWEHSDPRT